RDTIPARHGERVRANRHRTGAAGADPLARVPALGVRPLARRCEGRLGARTSCRLDRLRRVLPDRLDRYRITELRSADHDHAVDDGLVRDLAAGEAGVRAARAVRPGTPPHARHCGRREAFDGSASCSADGSAGREGRRELMSRTRRFLGGLSIGYFSMVLTLVVGLWLTPFLLGRIGTHEYGLWLITTQILGYLMLLDLGVVALAPRETAYATGRR